MKIILILAALALSACGPKSIVQPAVKIVPKPKIVRAWCEGNDKIYLWSDDLMTDGIGDCLAYPEKLGEPLE